MLKAVNWNEIEKEELEPGTIYRQVFSGEKAMLVLNTMYKGHPYLEPHHHPHEQILTIQAGRAKVTIADEDIYMGPGDMVHIDPDVPHTIEILSDEPVLNLDIFSPIREDYL